MKFKLFISTCLIYLILFNQVFAQVLFFEIFPNTDDDVNLEYIEIYNSGSEELSLSGYILKDKSEKEFIFGAGELLGSGQTKKYFRNDTKILLNNSDEDLFLYDNSGNLIDSFSYTSTVKGEVIKISPPPSPLLIKEGEEEYNTSSGSIEIASGSIDENSSLKTSPEGEGVGSGSLEIEKFNLVYSFQNPSYVLDKDKILTEYICDNSEKECKLNLDLRNSFTGSFNESDYNCKIDFGFSGWLNGEENKCNPSTVIFPKGEYKINFKITEKSNSLNFYTGGFLLKNEVEKEIVEVEKVVVKTRTEYVDKVVYQTPPPNPLLVKEGGKNVNEVIEKIDIQKPEIIIQSGLDENNNCKKEDCKLNLNYEIKNKQERCLWIFDGGKFSEGTENKCNPGYVEYGKGNFEVKLRVFQDGNEGNFMESVLGFRNEKNDSIPVNNEKPLSGILSPYQEKEATNIVKYDKIKINKVMPNPDGTDDLEYVEIVNNLGDDVNLKGCSLDDKIDGGSKEFIFLEDDFILKGKTKKYYKSLTALNFNNENDEVNLFCNNKLVDSLKWNFKVADGYYLDHNRLDIKTSNAKVLRVVDGDTIEIQFLDSGLVEKLRFIGVDTPETKNPNKTLEKYGIEASEFAKNTLVGKNILVEIDSDNFRDSYSRLLGYVILDGENFNQKLVRLGYAKAYLNYPFKYSVEFSNSEKEAKKEKLGIWKEDNKTIKTIFTDDLNLSTNTLKEEINLEDKNQNNIPDEFDEVKNIVETNTGEIIKKVEIDNEKSLEKYNSFISLGFNQKITKLKSGLKVFGKTIPDSVVMIEVKEKENFHNSILNPFSYLRERGYNILFAKVFASEYYKTIADNEGNYEINFSSIDTGDYLIFSKVVDSFGNVIVIEKQKELVLDEEYVNGVKEYNIKNEITHPGIPSLEKGRMLQSIITLQGKIGANKILKGNILTCYKTCSVNFDGSKSSGNIEQFIWNFGNGKIFEGINPGNMKYEKFGNYKVELKIIGNDGEESFSYFYVNFEEKIKKTIKPSSLNSFSLLEKEATDLILEKEDTENEKISKTEILLYFLIFVFSLNLIVLILRRDKLI